MGLYPDYYSALRTNILSQEPLPTLDRAYQLVSQDERVRLSKLQVEPSSYDAVGFAARAAPGTGRGRGRGSSSGPDRSRPVCTRCKRTGHDTSSCWLDAICGHCNKKGHPITRCYELVG